MLRRRVQLKGDLVRSAVVRVLIAVCGLSVAMNTDASSAGSDLNLPSTRLGEARSIKRFSDGRLIAFEAGAPAPDAPITPIVATVFSAGQAPRRITARDLVPPSIPFQLGTIGQLYSAAGTEDGSMAAFALSWWDESGRSHGGIAIVSSPSEKAWTTRAFVETTPDLVRDVAWTRNDGVLAALVVEGNSIRTSGSNNVLFLFDPLGKSLGRHVRVSSLPGERPEDASRRWSRASLQAIGGDTVAILDREAATMTVHSLSCSAERCEVNQNKRIGVLPGKLSSEEVAFAAVVPAGGYSVVVREMIRRGKGVSRVERHDSKGDVVETWRNPDGQKTGWRFVGWTDTGFWILVSCRESERATLSHVSWAAR